MSNRMKYGKRFRSKVFTQSAVTSVTQARVNLDNYKRHEAINKALIAKGKEPIDFERNKLFTRLKSSAHSRHKPISLTPLPPEKSA